MIFPLCALRIVLRIGVFDLQKQDLVEGAKSQINPYFHELVKIRMLQSVKEPLLLRDESRGSSAIRLYL